MADEGRARQSDSQRQGRQGELETTESQGGECVVN